MGLESITKCRLFLYSFIKQTFSIFTLTVFLIKLRFRGNFPENWQYSGSTAQFGGVTPHAMKSMAVCGDLNRELGRIAKLVNWGHYGYRWSILT